MSESASRVAAASSFVRFAASSATSTVVDQLVAWSLFSSLAAWLPPEADFVRIALATLNARLCSLALNFTLNRRLVFRDEADGRTLGRYLALASVVLMLSSVGVYLAHGLLGAPEWQAKLVCDLALFFLNYHMQRTWVFRDARDGRYLVRAAG